LRRSLRSLTIGMLAVGLLVVRTINALYQRDCFLLGCDAVSLVRFVLPSWESDVISHNKTITIVTAVLIPSVFSFTFSLCSYVFLMLSIFVRSCEYGNELSGSVKCGNFLTSYRTS
jgi:hypothetical protein